MRALHRTLRRSLAVAVVRLVILSFLLQSTAAGLPAPVAAQGSTPPIPAQVLEPAIPDPNQSNPPPPSDPPPQALFQPGAVIVPDPPQDTTGVKPLPAVMTPITAPIPVGLSLQVSGPATVGQLITYTLTITNQTGSPLRGLELRSVLNQSVHLPPGEPGFYNSATRQLSVTLPLLAGGATIQRSFRTRLVGAPHANRLHQGVAVVQPGVGQAQAAAETTVLDPATTATVGPAGGTLVSADARLTVVFPQGALSNTARIEQEWLYAGDLRLDHPERFFVVRLSATDLASGQPITQFAVPVSLTLQAGDLFPVGRSFWLQHYDPELKRWVLQSGPYTPEPASGLVTMTTSHFSELGGGELDKGGWRLLFNDPRSGHFNGSIGYSVALETPPGPNGVGPALELNYNSSRVNGLGAEIQADASGLGWTMDAVEVTRKLGHGSAIGGIAEEAQYNTYYASWCAHKNDLCLADEFSLLFQGASYTLVYTGTISGADIYRTADESFLRVRRIRCDSQCTNGLSGDRAISNQGGYYRPGIGGFRYDYWEVTSQDGTVYRLGARADSEQRKSDVCINYAGPWTNADMHACGTNGGDVTGTSVYRWRVDYVKDVYGNEAIYHYAETQANAQGYTNFNQANDGQWDRESYLDYVAYSWRTSAGGFWGYKLIMDLQCRGGAPSCAGADSITDADAAYGNDRGRLWFQRKFLRGVQVKQMQDASNGAIIREYRLAYTGLTPIQNSSRPPQRVLASVTPYGLNGYAGGSALPASTFGYAMKRNSSYGCTPSWDGYQWEYARLSQIQNGYGATIDLIWQADASESGCVSTDKPYSINWLLVRKTVRDGLNPDAVTVYTRNWPCYHYDTTIPSLCRGANSGALVGFGIVTETVRSASPTGPVLAVTDHRFYPDSDDWSLNWNGQDLGPRLYALNGREKQTRQWGWDAQNNRPSVVLAQTQSVYTNTVIYDSTALYENRSAADDALFIYQDETSQRQNNSSGALQVASRAASVYELTYGKVTTQHQYGLARTVPNGRFAHGLRSWGLLTTGTCTYRVLTGNRLPGSTAGKLELKHDASGTCNNGVFQNLGTAVSLGTTYRVSVRARATATGVPGFTLQVSDGQNAPATQSATLNTAWQVVSANYTTTNVQNLQIRLTISGGSGGSVYVDDVWYELLSEAGDEKSQATTYTAPNPSAWIVGLPGDQQVYSGAVASGTAAAQSSFIYNSLGALTTRRDYLVPGGSYYPTTYGYDAWGNQDTVTDALNRSTRTYYDGTYHTYPMTMTNDLTQSSYLRYDLGFGKVTLATNPNGAATELAYDAFGRLIKVVEPGDSVSYPTTQYNYTDGYVTTGLTGLRVETIQRETSGSATATRSLYEFFTGRGLLMQTRSELTDGAGPQQAVTNSAYDALGRVLNAYVPVQKNFASNYQSGDLPSPLVATRTQYDILGRTVVVTATDGTATTTVYDGLTTFVRDAKSHQRSTTVDAYGQLVVSHQYTGTVPSATQYMWATYQYNVLGQLISVTDQANRQTTMSYDPLGRKLGMVDPDMGSWTYSYDSVGNLVSQVSPREQATGSRTCLYYDRLNRLVGKRYYTGAACLSTPSTYDQYYYYDESGHGDGIGQRTAMTNTSGTVWWGYDRRGRVVTETRTVAGMGQYTFLYNYDAAGRLLSTVYPSGETVNTTYNAAWQPVTLSSAWWTYVSDAQYNVRGQPTLIKSSTSTNLWTSYSYFESGSTPSYRLSEQRSYHQPTAMDRLKLSYSYDPVGNISTLTDYTNSGQTQSFTYDPLDRLQNASTSGVGVGQYSHTGSFAYSYGPAGNIATLANGTYDYDPQRIHAATHVYRTAGGVFSHFNADMAGWSCSGSPTCGREQESGTGEWVLLYGGSDATTTVYRNETLSAGQAIQVEFKPSQSYSQADFALQLERMSGSSVTDAFGILATPGQALRVKYKVGNGTPQLVVLAPNLQLEANTWYVVRLTAGNGTTPARISVWKRDDPLTRRTYETTQSGWNGLSWKFKAYANTQSTTNRTFVRLDAYAELRSSSADVQGYRYDANGNMIARLEAGVLYAQSWDTENRLVGVTYGPLSSQTNSSYSFGYDPDGTRTLQVAPDGARSAYVGAGLYEETVNATTVFADSFPTSAGNWSAQSGSWSWVSAGPGEGYYAQQSKTSGQSTSIRTPAVVWGDITATLRLQVGAQQNALAGVVLRRPAGGGAAYFLGLRNSLSSYGCGIYEYDGAAWVLRASGGTACKVAQSTWQTVGVRAINGRLDLLVGGKLVASWTDTSPQGANGFGLQTFDGQGDFDDVQVYEASARSYYLFGGKRVALAQSRLALTGSAGEEYYLLSDHLGSTSLALYPNAGEVAGSRGWYYPFGDVRGTAPSGLPTDFQFAGQRLVGIGLYLMGARWYNPRLARWSSADALVPRPSNPQTLNRYSYTYNNPLIYTDATGHDGDPIGDFLGGFGFQWAVSNREAILPPGPGEHERIEALTPTTDAYMAGRVAGAAAAFGQGVAEIAGGLGSVGGGLAACGTGVLCLAGAPAILVGSGLIGHGAFVGVKGGYDAVQLGGRLLAEATEGGTKADRIPGITPPTDRRQLRRALLAKGGKPEGMPNAQAHHNLPWTFKDWFAAEGRGLNVNDPQYGRWVSGTPPGPHQRWTQAYENAWRRWISENPNANRGQVLAYMNELLQSGDFP